MNDFLKVVSLLAVIDLSTADWNSQRKYEKYRGDSVLMKGGISEQQKLFDFPYIVKNVYVGPKVRNNITIRTVQDLYSYTICSKDTRELFANLSSRTYKYSVCPDEFPEVVNFATIKEYCCGVFPVYCCNVSEFRARRNKLMAKNSFGLIFSVLCPLIFLIMIVVVLKSFCASRIRTRWNNIQIITRRGPPPSANYGPQSMPLVYPPMPAQQYPGTVFTNPPTGQPMGGQYPYGPPPGSYPYGPPHGQGVQGPEPAFNPNMPPPDYQKAILQ